MRLHVARLAWRFVISIERAARGRDLIRDNEIRQEKLDLSLVSYRLLYQRIFVFGKTYFI